MPTCVSLRRRQRDHRWTAEGRGTLGKLLTDPTTAKRLESSIKNLDTLISRLKRGQGSIGKLLNDNAFAESLNGATTNLRTLASG
jgi:phospholipid/cholesterol/gamma-HCH transport system substrate-binding protein